MSVVQVNISVGQHPAGIKGVRALAEKAGLRSTQCLEEIGVLTGQIDAANLEKLHRIPGVKITSDAPVSIAPPTDAVQ